MSHVRALKGPVWVLTAPYGSALKTNVHGSCGLRTGSVRCLEILAGPARADTTDYGRFAGPVRAVTTDYARFTGVHKPVRHPQGPVRCPHVHRTEPVG